MLNRLEENGHILRIFPNNDPRKVLIQLTEENRKIKKNYEEVSIDMINLFYKGFSDNEIIEFEGYLKRIFINLSE